jgi:hypothetical protein
MDLLPMPPAAHDKVPKYIDLFRIVEIGSGVSK